MGHLECSMVPSLSSQIIYIRCMDDCLVISKTKEDNKILFDKLNKLHNIIFFTTEVELNNELPFPDILILRKKDNFQTTIRRKTLLTVQYLNFHSFCSKRQKINLIKTLYLLAYKICFPCLL